jgi:DNA-binding PadR family transcriptional regulator
LTGEEVTFDPANLYRSLKRMIKDGLVTEADPPPEHSGTEADAERRRYYAITDEGTRLVRSEAARLDRLTAAAKERKLIPDTERVR